jgi:hypothetical protein
LLSGVARAIPLCLPGYLKMATVMLSETSLESAVAGKKMIRDGKPGLADSVRCVAASLRSE